MNIAAERILPQPKSIVFDWDNTLVDTWPVIHAALEHTFRTMGHEPWTFEQTKERVSKSLRDSFPGLFGERWEEARDVFYATFEDIHLDGLRPLAGAERLLARLKDAGLPLAIVSNKTGRFLREEVEVLGWSQYFQSIVGAGDAEKDKPDPAALAMALNGLNQPLSERVWFVGDSRSDLELAKAAPCTGIFVHPDHDSLVDTFSDCPPAAAIDGLPGLESLIFNLVNSKQSLA